MFKVGDKVRLISGITQEYWTTRSQLADQQRSIGTIIKFIDSTAQIIFSGLEHEGEMGLETKHLEYAKPIKRINSWEIKS